MDAVRQGHHAVARLLRERGGELGYDEAEATAKIGEMAKRASSKLLELAEAAGEEVNQITRQLI